MFCFWRLRGGGLVLCELMSLAARSSGPIVGVGVAAMSLRRSRP